MTKWKELKAIAEIKEAYNLTIIQIMISVIAGGLWLVGSTWEISKFPPGIAWFTKQNLRNALADPSVYPALILLMVYIVPPAINLLYWVWQAQSGKYKSSIWLHRTSILFKGAVKEDGYTPFYSVWTMLNGFIFLFIILLTKNNQPGSYYIFGYVLAAVCVALRIIEIRYLIAKEHRPSS